MIFGDEKAPRWFKALAALFLSVWFIVVLAILSGIILGVVALAKYVFK